MSRATENTGMFCWLFHGNRPRLAKHGETVPITQIPSEKVTNDAPLDAPTFSINHAERLEYFISSIPKRTNSQLRISSGNFHYIVHL